jgi:hypothetical protein
MATLGSFPVSRPEGCGRRPGRASNACRAGEAPRLFPGRLLQSTGSRHQARRRREASGGQAQGRAGAAPAMGRQAPASAVARAGAARGRGQGARRNRTPARVRDRTGTDRDAADQAVRGGVKSAGPAVGPRMDVQALKARVAAGHCPRNGQSFPRTTAASRQIEFIGEELHAKEYLVARGMMPKPCERGPSFRVSSIGWLRTTNQRSAPWPLLLRKHLHPCPDQPRPSGSSTADR